jgi:hypothetical protein
LADLVRLVGIDFAVAEEELDSTVSLNWRRLVLGDCAGLAGDGGADNVGVKAWDETVAVGTRIEAPCVAYPA